RRHTRFSRDWSSDVCSSDLHGQFVDRVDQAAFQGLGGRDEARRGGEVAGYVQRLAGTTGPLLHDLFVEPAVLIHTHGVFRHARHVAGAMQGPVERLEEELAET